MARPRKKAEDPLAWLMPDEVEAIEQMVRRIIREELKRAGLET